MILAHYYQDSEIQDLADFVGDSLGLSQEAAKTKADVIAFCGVHFMAETAKILNPKKTVVIPDLDAGCSLADRCPADAFEAWLAHYPGHEVVSYINCSAAVKALSTIICTASNAVRVVNWLPKDTTFGRRLYAAADGFQVQASGVMMGTDRTSIHKPEFCLPAQGFQIHRRTQSRLVIDRPHRYELPITRIDGSREVRRPDGKVIRQGAVYVYWFVSGNRLSNDHLERMWLLALDLVKTGELQRWSYMSLLGACPPGEEDRAFARLESLIRALVPEFQTATGPALGAEGAASGVPGSPAMAVAAPEARR